MFSRIFQVYILAYAFVYRFVYANVDFDIENKNHIVVYQF